MWAATHLAVRLLENGIQREPELTLSRELNLLLLCTATSSHNFDLRWEDCGKGTGELLATTEYLEEASQRGAFQCLPSKPVVHSSPTGGAYLCRNAERPSAGLDVRLHTQCLKPKPVVNNAVSGQRVWVLHR